MFWVVFGGLVIVAVALVLVDDFTEKKRSQDAAIAELDVKYPRHLRLVRDDERAAK